MYACIYALTSYFLSHRPYAASARLRLMRRKQISPLHEPSCDMLSSHRHRTACCGCPCRYSSPLSSPPLRSCQYLLLLCVYIDTIGNSGLTRLGNLDRRCLILCIATSPIRGRPNYLTCICTYIHTYVHTYVCTLSMHTYVYVHKYGCVH
jgi:hypothetical protein